MSKSKIQISSLRAFDKGAAWQIVWEWEDEISEQLSCPVKKDFRWFHWNSDSSIKLNTGIKLFGYPFVRLRPTIEFVMSEWLLKKGRFAPNTIPWIIDFFLDEHDTTRFIEKTKTTRLTLISSKEAYEKIIDINKQKLNRKLNIHHLGLSLPDRWMPTDSHAWMNKDYDLILLGRIPEQLNSYLSIFGKKYPNVSIGVRRIENGSFALFDSKTNELIGLADSRANYLNLLKRTKAFLYATPGVGGDKETRGYSQVTPRFLEALACGCNMVMMYPDNPDTHYYELEKFGPSVQSYEEFEAELLKAIHAQPDFDKITTYLKKHTTSTRVAELKQILLSYQLI